MRLAAAALLCGCFAAVGCGGSNTAATRPADKPQAGPAPATMKKVAAGVRLVSIKNFDFHPQVLSVTAGTTVRWINQDQANHTVTGEHGAKIKLGNVDPGHRLQMRFTSPGTYRYYCEYHPNMHARIVVR